MQWFITLEEEEGQKMRWIGNVTVSALYALQDGVPSQRTDYFGRLFLSRMGLTLRR